MVRPQTAFKFLALTAYFFLLVFSVNNPVIVLQHGLLYNGASNLINFLNPSSSITLKRRLLGYINSAIASVICLFLQPPDPNSDIFENDASMLTFYRLGIEDPT